MLDISMRLDFHLPLQLNVRDRKQVMDAIMVRKFHRPDYRWAMIGQDHRPWALAWIIQTLCLFSTEAELGRDFPFSQS